MKEPVKCESDFFFIHMSRQLSESGEPWTAMDAYLKIAETCNRCPIRECPGMLAPDHPKVHADQDVSLVGDTGVRELVLSTGVDRIRADAEETAVTRLFDFADALPRSGAVCDQRQMGNVESNDERGDRSAFARFLGWSAHEARS
ncbi:MAG: hypothetical protein KIT83_08655 [Bryobacterales bacterium]|nr:hypothetical protein [Bryobacterales bacterium]